MIVKIWDTREPLAPAFAADWDARLTRCPHANFSLDAAYLQWESGHGRRALAVLLEGDGRAGALVMRETDGGWTCGWPWRWQALIEDDGRSGAIGLAAEEAKWLFACASRLAGSRVLRFYVPCAPEGVPGLVAGATLLYAIDRCDDEVLQAMEKNKRRMVRRAQDLGYHVRESADACDFRRFAELQRETKQRHGLPAPPIPESPRPGEDWDEWRLPWMWLLVAERDGMIESGLGDGVRPGGVVEARAGASSPRARQDGVFALLSFHEARHARDRGYRWINLGGDTPFKREMAGKLGTRVAMYCWLGGGGLSHWRARGAALWQRMRRRAGRLARDLRTARSPAWLLARLMPAAFAAGEPPWV